MLENVESTEMPAPASIYILLQKVDHKDDLLTITPDPDHGSMFNVKYEQNNLNSVNTFSLSSNTISRYLNLFFESIEMDNDGSDFIQIEIPSFPTVVIRAGDSGYYASTILKQIDFLIQTEEELGWPKGNPSPPKITHSTSSA